MHCDICYIHRCYQPSFAAVYETVSKETSDKSEVIEFNVFNHGISYVSVWESVVNLPQLEVEFLSGV